MFKLELAGGAELAKQLQALPAAVSDPIVGTALGHAGEPIRSRAAARAPRGAGSGPHLADHIVISAAAKDESGVMMVEIGPEHQPNDFFYGYFQEFGTVFHGAHPFMRPAYDEGISEAVQILGSELWQAITRRVGGLR